MQIKSYAELNSVICVNIVLLNIFDDQRAFRKIRLKDDETNGLLTPIEEIYFIELIKDLINNNCSERAQKWFRFMKDVNEVKMQLESDPFFKLLYEELEALSCDPERI